MFVFSLVKGKKRLLEACVSFSLIFAVFNANAAVDWHLGVEMGGLSIADPDGDVDMIFTPVLSGGGVYKIDRTTSIKGDLFYLSTSGEGSNDSVGQNFTAYGLSMQYQKKVVFTRSFKPLFGAGMVVSYETATNRYLEDDYGYLLNSYPDDSRVGFGVVVSVGHDFKLYKKDFNVGIKHVQGLNSLSLSTLFVTYKF